MFSKVDIASTDAAARFERETVSVYAPVVRGFLLFVAAYYLIVTVNHFTSETGIQLVIMAVMSVVSAVAAAACHRALKTNATMRRLELAGLFGNLLLLTNLLYFYSTQYDSNRLVYFVLMVFLFAMTGATRRVAIASSATALASLYAVVWAYEPSIIQIYIYIGIASCIAALGISLMQRGIIGDALNAKLEAAARKVEAVAAAAHATKLSVTDNLTDLPNRRDFFQILNSRSERYLEEDKTLAVMLIDLDSFKPVNDTYGHNVGDSLLIAVGKRLQEALPDGCYLARIGGDEFAAITAVTSSEHAKSIGDLVCKAMRLPFDLSRVVVHVGATVGIAIRDDAETPPMKLVECADYALFNAKRSAKGTCAIFTETDETLMTRLFVIDQAMRGCDLESELEVVYQPQFDVSSNTVTGFEALARWHSKDLGNVDPGTFIGVAETSGMINQITLVLLHKAMRDLQTWPLNLTMSFNLSVHDVLDVTAIDHILEITGAAGIDPSRICFEITETVMMGDIEKAGVALQKLVDAGHEVALDDFGTGYSNFAYLHKLPIHKIKIDRSFVRDVTANSQSVKTISTLLQLARSLNKDCIIEGVETEVEYAAMQSLGARTIQGFYCGKPMVADKALELVEMVPISKQTSTAS